MVQPFLQKKTIQQKKSLGLLFLKGKPSHHFQSKFPVETKIKRQAEPQRWSHEICRTRTTWTLRKAGRRSRRRQGHHGNPRSTPFTQGFFGVRIWASSIFEGQHCWCLNRSQPVESGSLACKIHNVSIQFHTCISDIITMKRCHLTYHKLYINRGSRSIPKACQLDKLGWQSRSPNPTDPSNPWKTSPHFFLLKKNSLELPLWSSTIYQLIKATGYDFLLVIYFGIKVYTQIKIELDRRLTGDSGFVVGGSIWFPVLFSKSTPSWELTISHEKFLFELMIFRTSLPVGYGLVPKEGKPTGVFRQLLLVIARGLTKCFFGSPHHIRSTEQPLGHASAILMKYTAASSCQSSSWPQKTPVRSIAVVSYRPSSISYTCFRPNTRHNIIPSTLRRLSATTIYLNLKNTWKWFILSFKNTLGFACRYCWCFRNPKNNHPDIYKTM